MDRFSIQFSKFFSVSKTKRWLKSHIRPASWTPGPLDTQPPGHPVPEPCRGISVVSFLYKTLTTAGVSGYFLFVGDLSCVLMINLSAFVSEVVLSRNQLSGPPHWAEAVLGLTL